MVKYLLIVSVLFGLLTACNNGQRTADSSSAVTPATEEAATLGESDSGDISVMQTISRVDSVKINELLPYFNVYVDEFSPKNLTWYIPKSAPKYTNENGIYLYFYNSDEGLGPLRFRIQYYADDWLFFNKVQFSIDGKAYEFVPLSTETDCGNGGMIWEWFDEAIATADEVTLIKALASAKSAKMKFIGRQYHNIKQITPKQIEAIRRTVELYEAFGGHL